MVPDSRAAGCPKVGGIEVCGVQAISATRVLSYEPASKLLTADLAAEYKTLRNGTLLPEAQQQLHLAAGVAQALAVPTPHSHTPSCIERPKSLRLYAEMKMTLETHIVIFKLKRERCVDGAETVENGSY